MLRIMLTTSDSWYSRVLAWIQHSPYAHASIVLPDGRLLDSNICPGVDLEGNVVKSGVAIREPDYQKFIAKLVITFPDAPDSITERALRNIGEKFDWTGLFYFLLPYGYKRDWNETDGFYCSELITWCAKEEGYALLHPNVLFNAISPRDLMLSPRGVW